MNKIMFLVVLAVFACSPEKDNGSNESLQETDNALDTSLSLPARTGYLKTFQPGAERFPRSLEENDAVRMVPSSDWTSGFLPGSLCYAFTLSGDSTYLKAALEWLPFLEKEKINGKTHDMGFKINCSYGNALKLVYNTDYEAVMVQSAETLATRFNENVGCIKSWDFGTDRWSFPVIIDNMMNLELLFEATKLTGDSSYYKMAYSHAAKTLENHFRTDYSSYHVVDYDPETGEVVNRLTHQGYAAESIWARGQAWGLYGFAMAYRYTGEKEFLEQAKNIADFIIENPEIPSDKIPYWDLKDPAIPASPRDASAAAVIASALLELEEYAPDRGYESYAREILIYLLSDEYQLEMKLEVPFILDHSTGNKPKEDEIDVPINYADYYLLEAIVRAR